MDNHIHALLKEGDEDLGQSIKRITVGYVQWHNIKYARVGHLFQNRYRSEVVEDDAYFLTVLRYIHQNPTKAKIVDDISDYKWSSYYEYINEIEIKYVDTDFALKLFANEESFINFMKMPSKAECLEYEMKIRMTDEKLKEEISQILKTDQIMNLSKEEREKMIALIKEETQASNRQLSRVLGVSRTLIDKTY
jgi:putative transposase